MNLARGRADGFKPGVTARIVVEVDGFKPGVTARIVVEVGGGDLLVLFVAVELGWWPIQTGG